MRKVRRDFTVPEEVDREFRNILARLEGPFKKGAYSKWLTKLQKEFISSHNKQHQIAETEQIADPKRKEIMKVRELMQEITKHSYWNQNIEINIGTTLPDKNLREAIIKIKNLKGNPRDPRSVNSWIGKLMQYEFINRRSFNMYEVLDTGKDWSELELSEEAPKTEDAVQNEIFNKKYGPMIVRRHDTNDSCLIQ